MSSTNRGAERSAADYYPTPDWCTDAALKWLYVSGRFAGVDHVLDPCAGDGAVLRRVKHAFDDTIDLHGIDIRPECHDALRAVVPEHSSGTVCIANALDPFVTVAPLKTGLITNPPYSLAREFIEAWAPRVAWSAWLLRLNFLGSQKRAAWLRGAGKPSNVLVLPKRPSFTGGATDSCEYAWFIWRGLGATSNATFLDVLEIDS